MDQEQRRQPGHPDGQPPVQPDPQGGANNAVSNNATSGEYLVRPFLFIYACMPLQNHWIDS